MSRLCNRVAILLKKFNNLCSDNDLWLKKKLFNETGKAFNSIPCTNTWMRNSISYYYPYSIRHLYKKKQQRVSLRENKVFTILFWFFPVWTSIVFSLLLFFFFVRSLQFSSSWKCHLNDNALTFNLCSSKR